MLPILQVGPLSVQVPGLVLLVSLWIGLDLTERYAKRTNQDAGKIYNLVMVILISGILAARLVYAARHVNAFLSDPLALVSLSPALLDPVGGAIVGVLVGLIYGQRKKLALWPTLNALVPTLAVLSVGMGLAHLASGDAFGVPTRLPWGIQLWGEKRHPTQIYEIAAALAITAAVWPRRNQAEARPGVRFLAWLGLSAAARLFIESFRGDSVLLAGGLRTAQVLAWLALALALWLMGKVLRQTGRENGPDLNQ